MLWMENPWVMIRVFNLEIQLRPIFEPFFAARKPGVMTMVYLWPIGIIWWEKF